MNEDIDAPRSDSGTLNDNRLSLAAEIAALRLRLTGVQSDVPRRVRQLEERLMEMKGQLAQESAKNEKLSFTLREARENIVSLRDEVDKLTRAPGSYGTVVGINDDQTVDVLANGRKIRVTAHTDVDVEHLELGADGHRPCHAPHCTEL